MSTRTIQVQPKTLQGNITNSDVQFIIEDFVGLDGLVILQADIGGVDDVLYGTFEPNTVREEAFSAKILSNVGTTVTFECTRGLIGKHPYGTGGIAYPHDAGSKIVFSNNPNLFNKFIAKDNTSVVTGDIQVPTPATADSVVPKTYADTKASKVDDNVFLGDNTFNVSPQVPAPVAANDAVNLAYVLGIVAGSVITGFNAITISRDNYGRVKSVRDNQLGKIYLISYDANDNPTKIFDGTSTWRFVYTGDVLTSIIKHN